MTAAEIIAQVREYGGDIRLLPDGRRLEIERRSRIPGPLIQAAKLHADELRALLTTQTRSTAGSVALEAPQLLRQVIAEQEAIKETQAIREQRPPPSRRNVVPQRKISDEATQRFGPLTTGGKMCCRCLTIVRCRILQASYICDGCRRDDDISDAEIRAYREAVPVEFALIS